MEWLESWRSFRKVAGAWDDLYRAGIENSPFLSHWWLTAVGDAYGGQSEPRIAIAWRGPAIVAAAPFSMTSRRLLGRTWRVLAYPGRPETSRAQFLIRRGDEPAIATLLEVIAARAGWDFLDLSPMDATGVATEALREAARAQRLRQSLEPSMQSPFITLPSDWDEYLTGLSHQFRANVRRALRRASPEDGWEIETRHRDVNVDEVFDVARLSWQHERGTSIGSTPQLERLYRGVMQGAARAGDLRLALLRHRGTVTAFELNVVSGSTLYNLKIGFRPDYAQWSPGTVLKSHVLMAAMDEGLRECDLLGADEEYKMRWATGIRPHGSLLVFNRHPAPILLYACRFGARNMLGHRMPWLLERIRRMRRGFGVGLP